MRLNKRLLIGSAEEAFDPLKNFETVTYTGNGGTQKITGYIRKGAAFGTGTSKITLPQTYGAEGEQFSYSLWFNTSSADGSYMFAKRVGNNTFHIRIDNSFSPAGKICVNNWIGTAQAANNAQSTSGGYNDGSWHHFVFTYDGARTPKTQCYIDGVRDTGMNWDYDLITQSGYQNNIGNYDLNNQNFSGKIDQVRIFDKALSSAEVTTLSNETYASSTKSTTDIFGDSSGVALYELDEDAYSSNFGQAAVFNGSSSRIDTGYVSNLSNATYSFWVKITSSESGRLISSVSANPIRDGQISVRYNTDGSINFETIIGGASVSDTSTTGLVSLNKWHHITLTYSSGNTIKGYIDGVERASTAIGTSTTGSNTTSLNIGYYPRFGTYETPMVIDQVRIYSTALSSGDVTKLYNESSDVPTSNLVAYYKLDGDATDETGSYDGTASNVTYSTGVYGGTPTNVNFLGMAFQPDFVWVKERNSTSSHGLHDSVRGATKFLNSNNTNAEATNSTGLTSFDSNGFSVGSSGYINESSSRTYVAWCWKAGGAAVSGTGTNAQSITYSANPTAGFSIVKFTANGSASYTATHGLNQEPELVITKATTTSANWLTYVKELGVSKYLYLDTTAAAATYSNIFNGMSATHIAGSSAAYGGSNTFVNYCFHSVDGYQKVGSYTGNGSTSGPTVTTGFKPRFLMTKRTDGSSGWYIADSVRNTTNPRRTLLRPDDSNAEFDGTGTSYFNFNDTSFQVTTATTQINANGGTYIYLAIA